MDEEHLIFHYDKDDFLETCIKNIYNESRTGKNIASITGYFYLFAGRLIELHEEKEKKEPDIVSFSRFDDAVIYIRRNIRSRITIENLANYMRLDTSQVYRIFKKNTGMSPQCFITRMRMEKACEMLEKTDLPVKEIAEWIMNTSPISRSSFGRKRGFHLRSTGNGLRIKRSHKNRVSDTGIYPILCF